MSGGRITYEEALASLKAMFPALDMGVIETVLETNGGAMEPTVEQLLVMEGDTGAVAEAAREAAEAEEAARLADDGDEGEERSVGVGMPVSMGYAPAPVPLQSYPGYAPGQPAVMQVSGRPIGGGRQQPRWRHPLSDDFLRFPGVGLPALPGQHSGDTESSGRPRTTTTDEQMAADEHMAAMLQNDLFLEQVRADPELAAYILRDPSGAAALGLPVHAILPALQQQAQQQRRQGRGPLPQWFSEEGEAAAAGSSSRRGGGHATPSGGVAGVFTPTASHGTRPAGVSSTSATGPSGGEGGSWLTGMQRRLNTLAARFRRNESSTARGAGGEYASAPAGSPSAAAADGGGWFGRRSGSTPAAGGSGGAASRADRVRILASSGGALRSGADGDAGAGMVEIELTDTVPGAGSAGTTGSLNAGDGPAAALGPSGRQPAQGSAARGVAAKPTMGDTHFAIDDEDDEDEGETSALTGKGRTV